MEQVLKVLSFYGLLPEGRTLSHELTICCPFHDERHPSFGMNLENGKFFCFGCEARGGDITRFIQMYENTHDNPNSNGECDEWDALLLLHKIEVMDIDVQSTVSQGAEAFKPDPKESILRAWQFFKTLPSIDWSTISSHYLLGIRRFTPETLNFFDVRLNSSSSYPIVIPIYEQGKFRGYSTRRIDELQPKYLHNDGFPKARVLDGHLKQGPVMIVEGKLDQMKAVQFGFHNCVPTYGWHCSESQWKKIMKYATYIVSAYDNDLRGEMGHDRLIQLAGEESKVLRFPFPERRKDVCAMTHKEFSFALSKLRVFE